MLCLTKIPFCGLYLVRNCTKALQREVCVVLVYITPEKNNQGICALHYTCIQLYWIFLCSNVTWTLL